MNGTNVQEFEELIDLHGPDQVTQLMQKVISALEQLEVLSCYVYTGIIIEMLHIHRYNHCPAMYTQG